MNSWLAFAGIFALFFATHSIPVRPPVKHRLIRLLGLRGFTITYSMLSLTMLALLIWAAQQAPFVLLWAEAPWHRPVIWLGMLIACLILALAIGRPNPFSFGGRNNNRFDPENPGIIGYIPHPLLGVLALWAVLHLLMNGDLAHVVLFGVLSLFAILGQRIIDRRKKREMGADVWAKLLSKAQRHRPFGPPSGDTIIRLCAGGIVYLLLVLLHPFVIGAAVFL